MTSKQPFDVVVLGAINTDFLMTGDRFPGPGETARGSAFMIAPGGKGANQAVAAARLGAHVALISSVGKDERGQQALSVLKEEVVNTTHVRLVPNQFTGAALVMIDCSGEKQILAASGANHSISPAQVKQAAKIISSAKVLLLQFETPMQTVLAAARLAHKAGVKVVLDPAPAAKAPAELFKLLYAIRPNSQEAESLTGQKVRNRKSALRAAHALQKRGIPVVAVQAGSEGNLMLWDNEEFSLPKLQVKSVDSTGAGDAFAAALAVCIAHERDPGYTANFCNAAAAFATTKLGAQTALPTCRQVESLMRKQR